MTASMRAMMSVFVTVFRVCRPTSASEASSAEPSEATEESVLTLKRHMWLAQHSPQVRGKRARVSLCEFRRLYPVYLNFGPIGQSLTTPVTQACARRRERRTLLAGGGRRASRSHTLAASQVFERMHTLCCRRLKHLGTQR
jgi:hypothetical protein